MEDVHRLPPLLESSYEGHLELVASIVCIRPTLLPKQSVVVRTTWWGDANTSTIRVPGSTGKGRTAFAVCCDGKAFRQYFRDTNKLVFSVHVEDLDSGAVQGAPSTGAPAKGTRIGAGAPVPLSIIGTPRHKLLEKSRSCWSGGELVGCCTVTDLNLNTRGEFVQQCVIRNTFGDHCGSLNFTMIYYENIQSLLTSAGTELEEPSNNQVVTTAGHSNIEYAEMYDDVENKENVNISMTLSSSDTTINNDNAFNVSSNSTSILDGIGIPHLPTGLKQLHDIRSPNKVLVNTNHTTNRHRNNLLGPSSRISTILSDNESSDMKSIGPTSGDCRLPLLTTNTTSSITSAVTLAVAVSGQPYALPRITAGTVTSAGYREIRGQVHQQLLPKDSRLPYSPMSTQGSHFPANTDVVARRTAFLPKESLQRTSSLPGRPSSNSEIKGNPSYQSRNSLSSSRTSPQMNVSGRPLSSQSPGRYQVPRPRVSSYLGAADASQSRVSTEQDAAATRGCSVPEQSILVQEADERDPLGESLTDDSVIQYLRELDPNSLIECGALRREDLSKFLKLIRDYTLEDIGPDSPVARPPVAQPYPTTSPTRGLTPDPCYNNDDIMIASPPAAPNITIRKDITPLRHWQTQHAADQTYAVPGALTSIVGRASRAAAMASNATGAQQVSNTATAVRVAICNQPRPDRAQLTRKTVSPMPPSATAGSDGDGLLESPDGSHHRSFSMRAVESKQKDGSDYSGISFPSGVWPIGDLDIQMEEPESQFGQDKPLQIQHQENYENSNYSEINDKANTGDYHESELPTNNEVHSKLDYLSEKNSYLSIDNNNTGRILHGLNPLPTKLSTYKYKAVAPDGRELVIDATSIERLTRNQCGTLLNTLANNNIPDGDNMRSETRRNSVSSTVINQYDVRLENSSLTKVHKIFPAIEDRNSALGQLATQTQRSTSTYQASLIGRNNADDTATCNIAAAGDNEDDSLSAASDETYTTSTINPPQADILGEASPGSLLVVEVGRLLLQGEVLPDTAGTGGNRHRLKGVRDRSNVCILTTLSVTAPSTAQCSVVQQGGGPAVGQQGDGTADTASTGAPHTQHGNGAATGDTTHLQGGAPHQDTEHQSADATPVQCVTLASRDLQDNAVQYGCVEAFTVPGLTAPQQLRGASLHIRVHKRVLGQQKSEELCSAELSLWDIYRLLYGHVTIPLAPVATVTRHCSRPDDAQRLQDPLTPRSHRSAGSNPTKSTSSSPRSLRSVGSDSTRPAKSRMPSMQDHDTGTRSTMLNIRGQKLKCQQRVLGRGINRRKLEKKLPVSGEISLFLKLFLNEQYVDELRHSIIDDPSVINSFIAEDAWKPCRDDSSQENVLTILPRTNLVTRMLDGSAELEANNLRKQNVSKDRTLVESCENEEIISYRSDESSRPWHRNVGNVEVVESILVNPHDRTFVTRADIGVERAISERSFTPIIADIPLPVTKFNFSQERSSQEEDEKEAVLAENVQVVSKVESLYLDGDRSSGLRPPYRDHKQTTLTLHDASDHSYETNADTHRSISLQRDPLDTNNLPSYRSDTSRQSGELQEVNNSRCTEVYQRLNRVLDYNEITPQNLHHYHSSVNDPSVSFIETLTEKYHQNTEYMIRIHVQILEAKDLMLRRDATDREAEAPNTYVKGTFFGTNVVTNIHHDSARPTWNFADDIIVSSSDINNSTACVVLRVYHRSHYTAGGGGGRSLSDPLVGCLALRPPTPFWPGQVSLCGWYPLLDIRGRLAGHIKLSLTIVESLLSSSTAQPLPSDGEASRKPASAPWRPPPPSSHGSPPAVPTTPRAAHFAAPPTATAAPGSSQPLSALLPSTATFSTVAHSEVTRQVQTTAVRTAFPQQGPPLSKQPTQQGPPLSATAFPQQGPPLSKQPTPGLMNDCEPDQLGIKDNDFLFRKREVVDQTSQIYDTQQMTNLNSVFHDRNLPDDKSKCFADIQSESTLSSYHDIPTKDIQSSLYYSDEIYAPPPSYADNDSGLDSSKFYRPNEAEEIMRCGRTSKGCMSPKPDEVHLAVPSDYVYDKYSVSLKELSSDEASSSVADNIITYSCGDKNLPYRHIETFRSMQPTIEDSPMPQSSSDDSAAYRPPSHGYNSDAQSITNSQPCPVLNKSSSSQHTIKCSSSKNQHTDGLVSKSLRGQEFPFSSCLKSADSPRGLAKKVKFSEERINISNATPVPVFSNNISVLDAAGKLAIVDEENDAFQQSRMTRNISDSESQNVNSEDLEIIDLETVDESLVDCGNKIFNKNKVNTTLLYDNYTSLTQTPCPVADKHESIDTHSLCEPSYGPVSTSVSHISQLLQTLSWMNVTSDADSPCMSFIDVTKKTIPVAKGDSEFSCVHIQNKCVLAHENLYKEANENGGARGNSVTGNSSYSPDYQCDVKAADAQVITDTQVGTRVQSAEKVSKINDRHKVYTSIPKNRLAANFSLLKRL